MSNRMLAIAGASLLLIGLFGLVAVAVFGNTAFMSGPLYGEDGVSEFSGSLGERIYNIGSGSDGPIPRSRGLGRMGSGGCVTCHGPDGQGGQIGMMSRFEEAPPIDYESLTEPHEEHGNGDESEEAWTDADIARAIRDGKKPDGAELDPIMPRWDMSDREMDALIDYLKTLDRSE